MPASIMENIKSYKDLIVWQKSLKLAVKVYDLTDKFPREELYGLTSQMRRAAVSVPSNIAEGRGRGTKKDFVQFLRIAFGSISELQTQVEIAKFRPATINFNYAEINSLSTEIAKMLNSLISKLS